MKTHSRRPGHSTLAPWVGLAAIGVAVMLPRSSHAVDWLTMASTYTHDPASGNRVSQYAPEPAPEGNAVSNFRSSGYTNFRSSLNFGPSADNYHRVETWGDEVRPYGEWRFPFRPFSTPYPNWGPPFGGLGFGAAGLGNAGFGNTGFGNTGFQGFGPGGVRRDFFPPGGDKFVPGIEPRLGPGPGQFGPDRSGLGRRGPGFGRSGSFPGSSFQNPGNFGGFPATPFQPYPIGPRSVYPDPPFFDGFHPTYRD